MTSGRVSFIGAGPGSADLITVRGARRIAEADVVVWTSSSISPDCVREHANELAQLVDSARVPEDAVLEVYRRATAERLRVARLLPGDPTLWSGVQAHYDVCRRFGLEVELVPGVSTVSAAASAVGRELTPDGAHSVVLARADGGKTPLPQGEELRRFVTTGATIAMYVAGARAGELVEQLLAGGYTESTPVVVGHKPSWPDEQLLRTSLGELAATVKQNRLWSNTLFLVGDALATPAGRNRSGARTTGHSYRRTPTEPGAAQQSPRRPRGEAAQEQADPEPAPFEPRTSEAERGAEAAAAWWAVRDWQETARIAGRGGGRGAPGRPRKAADAESDGGSDPAAEVLPEPRPVAEAELVPGKPVAGSPKPGRKRVDGAAAKSIGDAEGGGSATSDGRVDADVPGNTAETREPTAGSPKGSEHGAAEKRVTANNKVSAKRTTTSSVSAKVDAPADQQTPVSASSERDGGRRRSSGRKGSQGKGRRS
ncbi:cobalt-precorrin-4/precorrin-4 C(11)-methyltransferase [Actinoalloteichus hymeniacidonis]|uniref:Precorrin-4 methylase n=1 Tax=Actinoalloteichus hymeniacidonis TaxID=340345 RepID=A0AAC9HNT9_9PSEU|nr:cobalt-precorrin-4/precorrin-4 C(11)-methyltransferase [Actinoalloteichus hymeniacidonis]AOS62634.1 precorrin-4 methylase [Actinoalloteichus hymeniacidonis]MBB5909334.1 precorrin-4/cobalt-precorrin-4 C11-methyltransferase [Actinoalloteichus hymeniacidonis]